MRIICLSAEAADWLWRIGAWEQVVGVTAFFALPPDASPRPRVSGFSTGKLDEIVALKPDLIIGFSDVQALLLAEAMQRGFAVLGTNQRTLADIEATLSLLAQIAGREAEAKRCLEEFRSRLAPVKRKSAPPSVYFEEWNDPLVSGIGWVSQLIERAGGKDIFSELQLRSKAEQRVVETEEVCRRNPQIILASWCGRPVNIQQIVARPGWRNMTAVCDGRIYEIPSEDILQPGFRLVNGYERMKELLAGEG